MNLGRVQVARALAVAALILAVTSRGELAVLGLLLVVPDLAVTAGLAVGGAVVASSWRWGTTSLEALSGAQAVLGPAGVVGPPSAAVGSWLAALALLAVLGRGADPVRLVAVGATVAAVVAGPAPGGPVAVRVAVTLGASAAALGLARWRSRSDRADRTVDLAGLAAGAGAVAGAAVAGSTWPPSLEGALVVEGAAIAAAAIGITLVAIALRSGPRWRAGGVSPTVEPRRAALAAAPSPLPR